MWWIALLFIPIVNFIILVPWVVLLGALPGSAGANGYGNAPE